jgi:hypothetical protein
MTPLLVALTINPVAILLTLLIFCVVVWAARALMAAFGIGDPIATVIYVLLVLAFLLWLFSLLGGGSPNVTIH